MPTSRPNRKPQIPVHSRHPTYLEQSIAIYFHLQLLYVVGDFLLLAGAISVQNENLKNSPGILDIHIEPLNGLWGSFGRVLYGLSLI